MLRTLVILALVGALAAEEPCACDQVTNDVDDLRWFLVHQGSRKEDVLPGELSPYVCDCNLDRARRSQKMVHPKLVGVPPTPPPTDKPDDVPQSKGCVRRHQDQGRNRCATGYRRIGLFCIKDPCYD